MIRLSNGSKQGDKSARHSKFIRNVAGRIFHRGFAAHENPLQLLRSSRVVPPPSWLHQGVFVWTAWPHRGAFTSFPKKLTNARQLPRRGNEHACNWRSRYSARLQVVPHFSSGIVERAKCERAWKSPHARKRNTRREETCAGLLTNTQSNMVLRSKLSKSHLGTFAFRVKLLQRYKTKAYFWS